MGGAEIMLDDLDDEVKLGQLLSFRLERLSADSIWAHQASGLRGALLRCLDDLENRDGQIFTPAQQRLNLLIAQGFQILELAAREIPVPEERR